MTFLEKKTCWAWTTVHQTVRHLMELAKYSQDHPASGQLIWTITCIQKQISAGLEIRRRPGDDEESPDSWHPFRPGESWTDDLTKIAIQTTEMYCEAIKVLRANGALPAERTLIVVLPCTF